MLKVFCVFCVFALVQMSEATDVDTKVQNLYANMVVEKKCGEEGAATLKKVLDKLDPKRLIDMDLAGAEPVVLHKNGETNNELKMAYLLRQTISESRYFAEFMPPLRQVLTQVSVLNPGRITLSASDRESFSLKACLGGQSPQYRRNIRDLGSQKSAAFVSSVEIGHMGNDAYGLIDSPRKVSVILVTTIKESTFFQGIYNNLMNVLPTTLNGALSVFACEPNCKTYEPSKRYECETYELDGYAANVLAEWQSAVGGDVFARLTFVDEDGEELVLTRVRTGDYGDLKCCAMKPFYGIKGERQYFVFAPWFLNGSVFDRYDWVEIAMLKNALPLIKSIKVELLK